jgi:hypothetical protein
MAGQAVVERRRDYAEVGSPQGLGGVQTQLAVEYAWKHLREYNAALGKGR